MKKISKNSLHNISIKEILIQELDKMLDKEGIYPLCKICDTEKCNIYENDDFDMLYPLCCKKLIGMAEFLISKNIIKPSPRG